MKVAVIGGVASTQTLVEALSRHGFAEIKVWGYEPADTKYVSGWRDLRAYAAMQNLPFVGFRKVAECDKTLRDYEPDILFVVGLSQIIPPSMMAIAKKTNVGFHPTALPRGRGRAALAWLILLGEGGAATFFSLRDGIDDGPIFVQEPFSVAHEDDAAGVEAKVLAAERRALDRWLPSLAAGDISAVEQDHSQATWFGRRTPEDSWLDWRSDSKELVRLIRASAPPHPGAYTFCEDDKVLLLRVAASNRRELGVPGRILRVKPDGSFEIQTGDGIIHVMDWYTEADWKPRVGMRLGYYAEAEIHKLRHRLSSLVKQVEELEAMIKGQE